MNIKHIFSLAALAVMTAACSSEDIIQQQPASQSGQTLPFRATISNSAGTRGLTAPADDNSDITAAWVVDEQIALIHGATIDVVKVESVEDATSATPGVATLSGDITNYVENEKVYLVYVGCQSSAMDDFKTELVQTFNTAKTADATITAITEDMIKANFKILYQDGTLTTINNGLDYRLATSTLTQTNDWVTLSDSPKLNSQFAIWKLTLKNASGAALAATQLDVIGVEVVASVSIDATTAAADPGVVYVMLPAGTADYKFEATVGTETYTVTHSGVSLTAGKFYQSTLTMTKTVNLARLEAAYEAQDGDVLTGTLANNVKISIAADAAVTLKDVNINYDNDNNTPDDPTDDNAKWSSGDYAGITCEGNATITLEGTNKVKGFNKKYPGIQVAHNTSGDEYTLTIMGSGSLDVSNNNYDGGAAYGSAGIGGGYESSCGNIVIKGGIIIATGGDTGAGIGSGGAEWNSSSCGNISILGGTIIAQGGQLAAGIGSGAARNSMYQNNCGDITIYNTVTKVQATKGFNCANSIGAGSGGTCGTVTIGCSLDGDGNPVGGTTGSVDPNQTDGETYIYEP